MPSKTALPLKTKLERNIYATLATEYDLTTYAAEQSAIAIAKNTQVIATAEDAIAKTLTAKHTNDAVYGAPEVDIRIKHLKLNQTLLKQLAAFRADSDKPKGITIRRPQ